MLIRCDLQFQFPENLTYLFAYGFQLSRNQITTKYLHLHSNKKADTHVGITTNQKRP